MKTYFKYLGIILLAVVIVFVLLNFDYFKKQLSYILSKPQTKQDDQALSNSENLKSIMEQNFLSIPSLDIKAPIKFVTQANEKAFQEALIDGVVQFPGTAKVGTVGNTYIFGHSSDFAFSKGKYKTVFALLPSIDIGAEIIVSDESGKAFTYEVIKKFVASKKDVHLLDQNTNGEKILTVQTSYPIGTALQRYIVVARLRE